MSPNRTRPYYRGDLVKQLDTLGWDWSNSVTNSNNKRPVLALVDDRVPWSSLPESDDEEVYGVWYRPSGWTRSVRYVIVRRWMHASGDTELFPSYTVIATSNDHVATATVFQRYRAKQGWENGFNGPLREMDLHHPPTACFLGNQLYYTCGLLAQQLLVAMQYDMLPADARACGLRPLIRDVIGTVAKLTRWPDDGNLRSRNPTRNWRGSSMRVTCMTPGGISHLDDRRRI